MATNDIPLAVSENQVRVPLRVNGGGLLRTVEPDNGSPYYVGARAYVTQNDNGATITVIDKEGTTTATVYNGTAGTTDYNDMVNKPAIEGVTLEGDKTYDDLNLQGITNTEIEDMLTL